MKSNIVYNISQDHYIKLCNDGKCFIVLPRIGMKKNTETVRVLCCLEENNYVSHFGFKCSTITFPIKIKFIKKVFFNKALIKMILPRINDAFLMSAKYIKNNREFLNV